MLNRRLTIVDRLFTDKDYDIRKHKTARWIDQKCTPDVIEIVADCILQYVAAQVADFSTDDLIEDDYAIANAPSIISKHLDEDDSFSSPDIWHYEYTTANVIDIFRKPNPEEKEARNEYDKFFAQPLEMFAYAGILIKQKIGNQNYYRIKEPQALEFISQSTRNALAFIIRYNTKVLVDSGIYENFTRFFSNQTNESFAELKQSFIDFTIDYTNINKPTEPKRIFTKILNPIAYSLSKHGTKGGLLSKDIITYDMLQYNRENFRDVASKKPKGVLRKVHEPSMVKKVSNSYSYQSQKAKRIMRQYNDNFRDGKSEVFDEGENLDNAIPVHHIFPESRFPEISMFYENLVVLTSNQHNNKAHPRNITTQVDRAYQMKCILSKIELIQEDINAKNEDSIYEFDQLLTVLSIGLDDERFYSVEPNDYSAVIALVEENYI